MSDVIVCQLLLSCFSLVVSQMFLCLTDIESSVHSVIMLCVGIWIGQLYIINPKVKLKPNKGTKEELFGCRFLTNTMIRTFKALRC